MAGNCRSGGHRRADQVGASTAALTTFKVTVTGGGTTFARIQAVIVHGQTHGAARQAPLEACFDKDLIQAFGFRLRFYRTRAWHNQRLYAGCHFTAFGDLRRSA